MPKGRSATLEEFSQVSHQGLLAEIVNKRFDCLKRRVRQLFFWPNLMPLSMILFGVKMAI